MPVAYCSNLNYQVTLPLSLPPTFSRLCYSFSWLLKHFLKTYPVFAADFCFASSVLEFRCEIFMTLQKVLRILIITYFAVNTKLYLLQFLLNLPLRNIYDAAEFWKSSKSVACYKQRPLDSSENLLKTFLTLKFN